VRSDSPVRFPGETLFGFGLVVAGQALFAAQKFAAGGLVVWAVGVAVIVWRYRGDDEWSEPIVANGVMPDGASWSSGRTLVPAAASLAAAAILWVEQRSRPVDDARSDLVALWLVSMLLAVIAVWRPRRASLQPSRAALGAMWDRRRIDVLVVAGLVLATGGLRLVVLQSYPRSLNGDEAAFAVLSRRVLDGEIRNPFGVGYLSHPLLWNEVQAISMKVFGANVAGARMPNALAGAAAVALAYVLVFRLTERRSTALAAGILLGTFHIHLYWSRSALPNGWTAASALLVLYLIDRALASQRAVGLLVTGIVVGLAQYFYFGSRILVPVVLGVVVIVGVNDWRRTRRLEPAARSTLARVALVVTGFALAVAPQVAYYSVRPYDFDSRSRSVSIFASGWLMQESDRTGDHPVVILIRQFFDAALVPFRAVVVGQYRGDPPYVGWVLALLSAIGLGLVTVRFARGGAWTGLALLFWFSAVGVATTIEPNTASRWTTTVPVICVFAALGLDVMVRDVKRSRLLSRRALGVLVVALVVATAVTNLYRYFRDDNQVAIYGDETTEIVEHLARSLQGSDPSDTVYLAGTPRLWYGGFANFAFRAPDVVGIDIERPLMARGDVPEISGPTLFVFIPERATELDVVRTRYPDGVLTVVVDSAGGVLYSAYEVVP
jgi:4-amino-4-deoxy-L-arabinose transferase-like glycosyltransferase